jgi:hypothetical protein
VALFLPDKLNVVDMVSSARERYRAIFWLENLEDGNLLGDFSVDAKITIRYMSRISSYSIHTGFLFG